MAKSRDKPAAAIRNPPKVRIARPKDRPFQLRYFCQTQQREIRISTGCRDEAEAERQRTELQAKLLLGIAPSQNNRNIELGPNMAWCDFREQYSTVHLVTVRDSSAAHAESRLDIATRIVKPQTLGQMADPATLQRLQSQLLAGDQSAKGKPRSHHTVRGYMNCILAALNWAYLQGWLDAAPRIRKLKVPRMKAMKGRPISESEFEQMLGVVEEVVGQSAASSWSFVLEGLWASALRLEELMHVSWNLPGTIHPIWSNGNHPILTIPAAMQKNDTEECIPLLPWFEQVLQRVPEADRTGWVFRPLLLRARNQRASDSRPDAKWVGRVISKIGRKAHVVVEPANERTGKKVKYASAHDLRRSCGERLREAGVPPLVICRVMRHSSWETTRRHYAPGNIQQDAAVLAKVLAESNGG